MATKVAISERDILRREKEMANRLAEKSELFRDWLLNTKEIIEKAEMEQYFYKEAFNRAIKDIEELSYDYLITAVMQACIDSVEFNWPSYINHLIGAIESWRDTRLILIDPRENGIEASIELEVLGDLDQWGEAVQAAREAGGFGLIKSADDRSRMWREKIYGTAREGVTLSRTTKTGTKDITENYSWKYDATINERLGFLEADEAPFWYLLEFGNAGTKFTKDSGGDPYPIFGPTNFRSNAEAKIATAFKDLYEMHHQVVAQEMFESLGLVGGGRTYKELYDEAQREFNEWFPDYNPPEIKYGATISKITTATVDLEAYITTTGALKTRARGRGGHFVPLPKD